MAKVSFFIDGFNVYHALKHKSAYHRYLWLDFRALSERFTREFDSIADVFYFSSYATWKPDSVKRHRLLISALEHQDVRIVMGKFKEKERYCNNCRTLYKDREEKQTDVNIASYLFKEAIQNNYDTAILITNDTDLIPAIKGVKEAFPDKKVGVIFPIGRWANELKEACDFWKEMKKKDLAVSQFEEKVVLPSGVILRRPNNWV